MFEWKTVAVVLWHAFKSRLHWLAKTCKLIMSGCPCRLSYTSVLCWGTSDTKSFSVHLLRFWTELVLAMTTEKLKFNFGSSWKAKQHPTADQLEGYCYVWNHRAEPWVGVWLFFYLPPCGESQVLLQNPHWKWSCSVSAKSGINPALWAESAYFECCGKIHSISPCMFKTYIILKGLIIIVRTVVLR